MKPYQIDCLERIKERPTPLVVDMVARDLMAAIRVMSGANGITSVVPIPPGSSGNPNGLSVLVARRLADLLQARCDEILVPLTAARIGRSHPKKSADLKGYSLRHPVTGFTVLVDDVATSGQHMELGLSALRASGGPAMGYAWIGPGAKDEPAPKVRRRL